jgi:hypothetical protein
VCKIDTDSKSRVLGRSLYNIEYIHERICLMVDEHEYVHERMCTMVDECE